jgi:hypothetical protein
MQDTQLICGFNIKGEKMAFKKMITAVDTHAGEPMRVITGEVPHIPGSSVFEKMKGFWEPFLRDGSSKKPPWDHIKRLCRPSADKPGFTGSTPMYSIPQIHSRKDSGWVIYGRCKEVTGNGKDDFTRNSGFLHLCKGDSEDLFNLDFGNDIYWNLRVY